MIKINLVGQNHRRESARRRAKFGFVAMLIGVACLSGAYAASVERALVELRQEGQLVEVRAQAVQSMRKKIATLESQRKTIQPRLEALRKLHGQRALVPQLLYALGAAIPEEAWLVEARLVDGDINLVGMSPSESISNLYVQKLRETKLFSEVTLSKATQRFQADVTMQEFVIKATVKSLAFTRTTDLHEATLVRNPA